MPPATPQGRADAVLHCRGARDEQGHGGRCSRGLLCKPSPGLRSRGWPRERTGRCHRRPYFGRGLGGTKGIVFSSAGASARSLVRLLCSKQTRLFCLSHKILSLAFKAVRDLTSVDPANVLPSSSPFSSGHPSRTCFLAVPQAHGLSHHLRAFARAAPSVPKPSPRSHGLHLLTALSMSSERPSWPFSQGA